MVWVSFPAFNRGLTNNNSTQRKAQKRFQFRQRFFLTQDEIFKPNLDPTFWLRCSFHQLILVDPGDGALFSNIVRRLVLDAEITQIIRFVPAKNPISRIANPVDIFNVGERP